ncbi:hypothetical protein ACQY0O_000683 [Thecaphora frezii]
MSTVHVVMVSWPAIGHARPMMDFGASLLSDHANLELTFICSSHQIATLRRIDPRTRHPRLHFLGLEVDYRAPTSASDGEGSEVEPEVVLTMQAAHHLSSHFGSVYASLPFRPSVVICNWMIQRVADEVRTQTPETKLIAFFDNAATFVTRMLGPLSIGGYGGVQSRWLEHCRLHPDISTDDLAEKERLFGRRAEGWFEIPNSGIERMYDNQMSPQAKAYLLKVPLTPSLIEIQRLVELSDALLINTHESVEGKILQYLRSVVEKEIYAIGSVLFRNLVGGAAAAEAALLPPAAEEEEKKPAETPKTKEGDHKDDEEVRRFLDSHAPGSVLYISFGTMFRPTPSQLVQMLEILVHEQPSLPFLWTLGSGKDLIASCPAAERDRVRFLQSQLLASGRGRLVDWADQHAVLQHPSTGFFLSHGGWNSVQESLLTGKPLLVFPFFGDQLFDAYLVKSLGVAYHIQSSRFETPEAFLESYRYALQLCHGGNEEGERLKRNAKELAERMRKERLELGEEMVKEGRALAQGGGERWSGLFGSAQVEGEVKAEQATAQA